jgi:hypothetical protein
LSVDNGPYGVLIWTQRVELQELFEEQIFNTPDVPNPAFVICIPKAGCKDKKGNFKFNKVSSEIQKALKSFSPLLLLQEWEESSFVSATQVTNQLADLSVRNAANLVEWRKLWRTEFLQLLHALAIAEAGQQLNNDRVLSSLYGAMNPLHSDRMESNVPGLRKSLSPHSDEIMAFAPTNDRMSKAKLNSMLHLAMDDVNEFYAGNIYSRSKFGSAIPTVNKLLDDFVQGNSPENRKQNKLLLAPFVKSVAVETNATCDHSQNNVRVARLLAGLLVPEDKSSKIKGKTDFVYRLGPVFLETRAISAGEYYLYFSARHLITLELNQILNARPFARLRGQAFSDLQAWFARQSTRPGMLLLN